MEIPLYQAMTAAEFLQADILPPKTAWMACHFSPYATGLTDLPTELPSGSLLIVNDRVPICGHDPELILSTVANAVARHNCCGVLLDFQVPGCQELHRIVDVLLTLPCPVAVSSHYANEHTCPVFLPPIPLDETLDAYLAPWKTRSIWLEIARQHEIISVTEGGLHRLSEKQPQSTLYPHFDTELYCAYQTEFTKDSIRFLLYRGNRENAKLLSAAQTHGVSVAVALWQDHIEDDRSK